MSDKTERVWKYALTVQPSTIYMEGLRKTMKTLITTVSVSAAIQAW